ncbi:Protein abnormal spindle [Frankliniella fusca]|uniref:Protein abnormal spindle n=1 Tax=Frankliniella fusca TaxID=407009 RepID=A0AAE1HJE2_9NEOP|nr:Protein abnormal spindle [Frankliniella fusca]
MGHPSAMTADTIITTLPSVQRRGAARSWTLRGGAACEAGGRQHAAHRCTAGGRRLLPGARRTSCTLHRSRRHASPLLADGIRLMGVVELIVCDHSLHRGLCVPAKTPQLKVRNVDLVLRELKIAVFELGAGITKTRKARKSSLPAACDSTPFFPTKTLHRGWAEE